MSSKQNDKNIIICLAHFIRWGYYVLMFLVFLVLKIKHVTENISTYVLFSMVTLYGMYYLLGLRFEFKHLYCAMQDAYHLKMTPYNICDFGGKTEREIKLIGYFFIIVGVFGIISNYFGI